METKNVSVFLAVAETGSITRAAKVLGISQPHVTRIVKELEAEIGLSLLEKVGRRIALSEAGIIFEIEARRMVQAFSGFKQRVLLAANGSKKPLRIAATPSIAISLLPEIIANIDDGTLPEIHIVQLAANNVAQEVRDGMAAIGISSLPLDVPGLKLLREYTAPVAAVMHKSDRLVTKERIKAEDFKDRWQVTMLDPMRFQRQLETIFTKDNIQSHKYIRTNASATALQLVRHMRALAVLDPVTAWFNTSDDIVVRPVATDALYHWGIVQNEDKIQRPVIDRLIAEIDTVVAAKIPNLKKIKASNT